MDIGKLIDLVGTFEFGGTIAGEKVIAALSELLALRKENAELRKKNTALATMPFHDVILQQKSFITKLREGLEKIASVKNLTGPRFKDSVYWEIAKRREIADALLSLSPESVNEEYEALKVIEAAERELRKPQVVPTEFKDHEDMYLSGCRRGCIEDMGEALARLDEVREGGLIWRS